MFLLSVTETLKLKSCKSLWVIGWSYWSISSLLIIRFMKQSCLFPISSFFFWWVGGAGGGEGPSFTISWCMKGCMNNDNKIHLRKLQPEIDFRAKIFLEEVLRVYSSKYMNASRMLGDQLALAWVVKSHPSFDARRFTKAQPFVEDITGASVLFLPCTTYNWTPPEGAGQFHGMPLDVKVCLNI